MPETGRENIQRERRPRRPGGRRGPKRPRGPRINKAPILAAIVFILVVLVAALGSIFIKKYTPTKERANLQEYYNVWETDDMAVI